MEKSREEKIKERLPELESIASSMEAFSKRKAPLHIRTDKLKKHHGLFNDLAKEFYERAKECKNPEDWYSLLALALDVRKKLGAISGASVSSLDEARTKIDRLVLQVQRSHPKLEEELRQKEDAAHSRALAFSKKLFQFSGEILEGGAFCIGIKYSGYGVVREQERLKDFFEKKKEIKKWERLYPGYWFQGMGIEGGYCLAKAFWGVEVPTFFLRFSREEAEYTIHGWLSALEDVECSFHFYLDKESSFQNIHFGRFLEFCRELEDFFGGRKPDVIGVEFRLPNNLEIADARKFFNTLLSYESDGLSTKIGPDSFCFRVWEGQKILLDLDLYSYGVGEYYNFFGKNFPVVHQLAYKKKKQKTGEPLVISDADYEILKGDYPKIGGVRFSFPKSAEELKATKKCFETVLSCFRGRGACARKRSDIKSEEISGAAVTIHFLF